MMAVQKRVVAGFIISNKKFVCTDANFCTHFTLYIKHTGMPEFEILFVRIIRVW